MTHPIIQAEIDEFRNDILKNYGSLNHQVCSRAMTIEDMLEDIMPKFSAALHRAVEKVREEEEARAIDIIEKFVVNQKDGFQLKNILLLALKTRHHY